MSRPPPQLRAASGQTQSGTCVIVIGFYVHHHGTGHLHRTAAVLPHLAEPAAVLTSAEVPEGLLPADTELIQLPTDVPSRSAIDPTAGDSLHWAPLAPDVQKPRVRALTSWLLRPESELLVCDVSVEAALLARLCGVACTTVRSHGVRTDPPHALGRAVSVDLVAPYPAEFEHPGTPADVVARTFHAGFVCAGSTVNHPAVARAELRVPLEALLLVIVVGSGGSSFPIEQLESLAEHLPDWEVAVLGLRYDGPLPVNVRCPGWTDDVSSWLRAADVVASHAGHNLVTEVLRAGAAFVCVPEQRPFNEQRRRAERLDELGCARVLPAWPEPHEWRDHLSATLADSSGRRLPESSFDGARRLAARFEHTVRRLGRAA